LIATTRRSAGSPIQSAGRDNPGRTVREPGFGPGTTNMGAAVGWDGKYLPFPAPWQLGGADGRRPRG